MNPISIKPHVYFLIMAAFIPILFLLAEPMRLHIYPYNTGGMAPFIAGLWLLMRSLKVFQEEGTPERIGEAPKTIVARGPYRVTRNPQYLGGFLMLLGIAVIAPTLPGFSVPFLFIIIISILFIPFEEKKMRDTFGTAYDEYRKQVRRWI